MKKVRVSLVAASGGAMLLVALALTTGTSGQQERAIAAGPMLVRSVDDAVRDVYQEQFNINMPVGSFGGNRTVFVPVGKRLVIEQVSAGAVDQGQVQIRFEIMTTVNGEQAQHFVPSEPQGFSNKLYYANRPMRIYADGGTNVVVSAFRPFATAVASASITISGYFVDVQ